MKRLFSGQKSRSASPNLQSSGTFEPTRENNTLESQGQISPELSPIFTLVAAQSYRQYYEGIFMLLQDLNSDGKPGERKWNEVYGVLTGTQLAVWDAEKLSEYKDDPSKLASTASKPMYINFTDATFKALDTLPSTNGQLHNVIVLSTTLKNRYLLQFNDKELFKRWNAAFRLTNFESTALQEAYTAAILSSRGSRLSDIKVILAETKFEHQDWVSVRFGTGMPWKKCFAVVEPPAKKSKKDKVYVGRVVFYENEKKSKKGIMATITRATSIYAAYPQSALLVDRSTLIKLEGTITFSKEDDPKDASVFLMPEEHSSVPGYDTLIRFIVPLMDAFNLYGRPKRLNADKREIESLLFGLPVLPKVHYLEIDDLLLLTGSSTTTNWTLKDWTMGIKKILLNKMQSGYTGCGSAHGITGAVNSLNKDNSSRASSPRIAPSRGRGTSSISPAPQMPKSTSQNSLGSEKYLKPSIELKYGESKDSIPSEVSREDDRSPGADSTRLSEVYRKYSEIQAPSSDYVGPEFLTADMNDMSLGPRGPYEMNQRILSPYSEFRKNNASNSDSLISSTSTRTAIIAEDFDVFKAPPTANVFDPTYDGYDNDEDEGKELPKITQTDHSGYDAPLRTPDQPTFGSEDKFSPLTAFKQQLNSSLAPVQKTTSNSSNSGPGRLSTASSFYPTSNESLPQQTNSRGPKDNVENRDPYRQGSPQVQVPRESNGFADQFYKRQQYPQQPIQADHRSRPQEQQDKRWQQPQDYNAQPPRIAKNYQPRSHPQSPQQHNTYPQQQQPLYSSQQPQQQQQLQPQQYQYQYQYQAQPRHFQQQGPAYRAQGPHGPAHPEQTQQGYPTPHRKPAPPNTHTNASSTTRSDDPYATARRQQPN
ncbi:hypothetical protein LJB42_003346 [Komagataella kurtzmanii]|nr:hypothetical protein LJB42_003346 [Komagataella kurtzmanii]